MGGGREMVGFVGFFRHFAINYFPITPLLGSTLGKQQCDWNELDEFFRAFLDALYSLCSHPVFTMTNLQN